jgi:hypothetical protein
MRSHNAHPGRSSHWKRLARPSAEAIALPSGPINNRRVVWPRSIRRLGHTPGDRNATIWIARAGPRRHRFGQPPGLAPDVVPVIAADMRCVRSRLFRHAVMRALLAATRKARGRADRRRSARESCLTPLTKPIVDVGFRDRGHTLIGRKSPVKLVAVKQEPDRADSTPLAA